MLKTALIVARKETIDSVRDFRAVISSLFYALMGPLVVGLVAATDAGSNSAVLTGMMSVFTLVAAFVGGMNIAMDTVAGERERKSLLPLLLNPVRRFDILLGKWIAVSLFALAGLLIDLAGFAAVLGRKGIDTNAAGLFAAAIAIVLLMLTSRVVQDTSGRQRRQTSHSLI